MYEYCTYIQLKNQISTLRNKVTPPMYILLLAPRAEPKAGQVC